MLHYTCLLPLFPFLAVVKSGHKLAKEVEREAQSIIEAGLMGESGEIPLAHYNWQPSPRGKTQTTHYVVQVSTFAYTQKMKRFADAPPPTYADLRIDIRAKTTFNAGKRADKSGLQEGSMRFAWNGYVVEYEHFIALLKSKTFKDMLTMGKEMVKDFFAEHPSLDPEKFLMTPKIDPDAVLAEQRRSDEARKARAAASQQMRSQASQIRVEGEEEVEEEDAMDRTSSDQGGREDEDDPFARGGVDDDEDLFRDGGELDDTIAAATAAASAVPAARGKKTVGRSSRK